MNSNNEKDLAHQEYLTQINIHMGLHKSKLLILYAAGVLVTGGIAFIFDNNSLIASFSASVILAITILSLWIAYGEHGHYEKISISLIAKIEQKHGGINQTLSYERPFLLQQLEDQISDKINSEHPYTGRIETIWN